MQNVAITLASSLLRVAIIPLMIALVFVSTGSVDQLVEGVVQLSKVGDILNSAGR